MQELRCGEAEYSKVRGALFNEFFGVEVPRRPPPRFALSVRADLIDGVLLAENRVQGCITLDRTSALAASDSQPERWAVNLCVDGEAEGIVGGRRLAQDPQIITLAHRSEPFCMATSARLHSVHVVVPESLVRGALGGPPSFASLRQLPRRGLARAASEVLLVLVAEMASLSPEELRQGLCSAVVLLDAAARRSPEALERAAPALRAHRRARILRYLDAQLTDPALSPAGVAAAMGMSLRAQELLFQETEQSVRALILERRLHRCRDELLDPASAHLSISEIAFRWGFNDPAHFSRAFKQCFGMSARELRARR